MQGDGSDWARDTSEERCGETEEADDAVGEDDEEAVESQMDDDEMDLATETVDACVAGGGEPPPRAQRERSERT